MFRWLLRVQDLMYEYIMQLGKKCVRKSIKEDKM